MNYSKVMYKIFVLIVLGATFLPAQDRIIRPGDSIDVVVYGHQELSRIVTVNSGGSIDFPFMQNIPVDGMTLEELRRFMEAQLSRYLDGQPVMTVSFADTKLLIVNVLGHVASPGTIQLPTEATLQEAIAKAGGALPGASIEAVNVIREKDGKSKKYSYNLYRLNLLGDLKHNPMLQNGDIVLVTGNSIFSSVKVIGSVSSPGVYEPPQGATLLDMIFLAGGLNKDADVTKIRYVSPSSKESKQLEIDLDAYFAAPYNYDLPRIIPGDIIIVPEKNQTWKNVLSIVGSLSSILSMIYLITRIQSTS